MKSDQRVLLRGGTIGAALKAATGSSVADYFGVQKPKPRAAGSKKKVVVMAISAQPDMTQLVGAEI